MKNNIVVDTDFLISFFFDHESTHDRAKKVTHIIQDSNIYMIDLVKFELATVLSRKYGHTHAKRVIQEVPNMDIMIIGYQPHESNIWNEFLRHSKKNISFVDCANVVIARHLKAKIASFDTFYPQDLRVA